MNCILTGDSEDTRVNVIGKKPALHVGPHGLGFTEHPNSTNINQP